MACESCKKQSFPPANGVAHISGSSLTEHGGHYPYSGSANNGRQPFTKHPVLVPNLKQMGSGVIKIFKNHFEVDLATSSTIAHRKSICMGCDKLNKGIVNQCSLCNCVINQKVMQASESCPLKKW